MDTLETREKDVKALENILRAKFEIQLPQSYHQFLLEHGSTIIAGYKIYGIPTIRK